MFSGNSRPGWVVVFYLLTSLAVGAVEIPPVPEYQLGDMAEGTIKTPVELSVVDTESPQKLQANSSLRAPAILRFNAQLVKEVEAEAIASFQRERDIFMAGVRQCYRREWLNTATIQHPGFIQFLAWLRQRHPECPCAATNLVRAWARGDSGDALLYELVPKLRQGMTQLIRPDTPALNQSTFLIFTPKRNEGIPDLALVEKRGRIVSPQEVYTLSEARQEIVKSVSPGEQPLARFLANALRPNCIPDLQLTARLRKKKAAEIRVVVRYGPGEILVQSGQVIDAKAQAALEALRNKRDELLEKEAAAQLRAERIQSVKDWLGGCAAWVLAKFQEMQPLQYGLLTALLGLLLVLHFLRRERRGPRIVLPVPKASQPTAYTVILNPHRNETIFLPVKVSTPEVAPEGGTQTPVPVSQADAVVPGFNDAQWLERAREAEERAQELLAMVREGLAPHLAKELMNKLVQELIAQRSALLETQQVAGREITAIEGRFNAIYEQLQEQLQAYERRAQELEGKLASKDEEAAELIKAMIMNQKKLQETQSANSVES